jgi:MFS transporter, PPP family, 3-phenylpropionic acid transporter
MPSSRHGTRPLSAFYFAYFAFIGVFFTYCGLFLQARGFSAQEISWLIAATQIVRVFATPAWGWLADHLHMRMPIVRTSLALATLVFAANFATPDFVWLLLVFALMSGMWAAAMPVFEAGVLSRLATASGPDMGRFGRIRLWGSIGYIVAVAAAGALFDVVSVLWLSTLVFGLMLVAIGVAAWVPERMPETVDAGPAPPLLPALVKPGIPPLFVCAFLNSASQGASFVFYSIYMVDSGHNKTAVGALWSIGVVAEIGLFLVLAKVIARVGYQALWRLGFAASVVRYIVVALVPGSFVVQALAQTIHMFTFGTHHATALAVIHKNFAGRLASRGQALYGALSFALGSTVGGLVAGWTWQHWGARNTFLLSAAIAATALTISLIWRLPQTQES